MSELELYGTASCPSTRELREALEWQGKEFVEFDVERDAAARRRMKALSHAPYTVPVLIEDGKVIQVGWQGRGCVVDGQ